MSVKSFNPEVYSSLSVEELEQRLEMSCKNLACTSFTCSAWASADCTQNFTCTTYSCPSGYTG